MAHLLPSIRSLGNHSARRYSVMGPHVLKEITLCFPLIARFLQLWQPVSGRKRSLISCLTSGSYRPEATTR